MYFEFKSAKTFKPRYKWNLKVVEAPKLRASRPSVVTLSQSWVPDPVGWTCCCIAEMSSFCWARARIDVELISSILDGVEQNQAFDSRCIVRLPLILSFIFLVLITHHHGSHPYPQCGNRFHPRFTQSFVFLYSLNIS